MFLSDEGDRQQLYRIGAFTVKGVMKPFKAQCGSVERKEYVRESYDHKKHRLRLTTVYAKLCEKDIWFEPSLKEGVWVGRCSVQTHNPVYKIVA